jgi:MYXO-CTERM domain-containing protein
VNIEAGGDYTWTFLIEGGTLIEDTSQWHLGGQYANGWYRSPGDVISTDGGGTPPVPEPTGAVLFGLGALLVTRSVRRR